jgi:membrane protease YdiL (CAAX protease family)/tetratricopeptide (TPR) repeat protein
MWFIGMRGALLARGTAFFLSAAAPLEHLEFKSDIVRKPFSESLGSGADPQDKSSTDRPFSESLGGRPTDLSRRRLALRRRQEANVRLWRSAVERQPTALWYYHQLAYSLDELGQYDEAIDVCNRILVLNPLDPYALWLLGRGYLGKGDRKAATEYLQQSVSYDPFNFSAQFSLGSSLYQRSLYREAAAAYARAVDLKPRSFDANYWLGLSFVFAGDHAAAAKPLQTAAKLEPSDFAANHWAGIALARTAHHKEAIVFLERALALRQGAMDVRILLFASYLLTGEYEKGFHLFPVFVIALGTVLLTFYALFFALLAWLSFRTSSSEFPGLFFSLGWFALFFEGQIAFIFLVGFFVRGSAAAGPIVAAALAALPMIAIALLAFRRRPWGAPFRWPFRVGGWSTLAKSALYLVASVGFNFAFATLVAHPGGHFQPLQKSAPLLVEAVRLSPVSSLLSIALVIPIAEEILFRGLLFGALQKRWRPNIVIIVTALLFAAIHLELVAYIPLFFLGLVLGWARSRSGSIGLPILIHSVNNFLAMCALLATTGV